jgi:hypothetical protein
MEDNNKTIIIKTTKIKMISKSWDEKVNPSFVVGIDPNMQNRGLPLVPPAPHTQDKKKKSN